MKQKISLLNIILFASFSVFQVINYSLSEFALNNILPNSFWPTIISFAFCVIDITIIALAFSDYKETDSAVIGAWILGSAMNSSLHWWATFLQTGNNELSVGLGLVLFIVRIFICFGIYSTIKKEIDTY